MSDCNLKETKIGDADYRRSGRKRIITSYERGKTDLWQVGYIFTLAMSFL